MKVYTEINYEFKNGSLVEQSSKFYYYEGPVVECKNAGSTMNKVINKAKEDTAAATRLVQRNTRSIQEGPTGIFRNTFEPFYGGSLKKGVEHVQKQYRDTEDDFHEGLEHVQSLLAPAEDEDKEEGKATDVTPEEREAILQQGLVAEGGRESLWSRKKASTGSTSSSILDPPTR